jgi:DNA-binding MarR family transcriptional regulator
VPVGGFVLRKSYGILTIRYPNHQEEEFMPGTGDDAGAVLELLPELALALRAAAPHEQARREHPQLRLTARQMAAVIHLGADGPQTMSEFAGGMNVSRASASELVERLEEKGMVVREHGAADRRQINVHLSPHADRMVQATLRQRRQDVRDVLGRHPDVAPASLLAVLRDLTATLKETRP